MGGRQSSQGLSESSPPATLPEPPAIASCDLAARGGAGFFFAPNIAVCFGGAPYPDDLTVRWKVIGRSTRPLPPSLPRPAAPRPAPDPAEGAREVEGARALRTRGEVGGSGARAKSESAGGALRGIGGKRGRGGIAL